MKLNLRKIDALFSAYEKSGEPGYAVAVLKYGRTVYQRGFGSKRLGVHDPITPRTVFNLGSVSKQFTAFCLLLLQDRGVLSLEDSLCKHLPELPRRFADIKLRHLIHHNSGIPSSFDLLWVRACQGHFTPSGKNSVRLLKRQKEMNFEPGGEFCYNNEAYLLVAEVIKRRSGKSLADFAKHEIFEPLGMRHSRYREEGRSYVPELAQGHRRREGRWIHEPKLAFKPGPGDLWSNLEDLAQWERNFFQHRVGSARVHREMLKPAKHKRRLAGDADYAAGLEIFHFKRKLYVGHDGMDIGAVTNYHRLPAQGLAILLLSNREDPPSQLAADVLRMATGDPVPKIPKRRLPRVYRGWSGYYEDKQSRAFWRFSATAKGYSYHTGDPGPEIHFDGKDRFYYEGNPDISFHFNESLTGQRSIEVRHRGKLRRRLSFLGRGRQKFVGMKSLVGLYRHAASGYEHEIRLRKGKLCFLHPFWLNQERVELWALGPDKLATTGGLYMDIQRNAKGEVITLDEFEPAGRYKHVRMAKVRARK